MREIDRAEVAAARGPIDAEIRKQAAGIDAHRRTSESIAAAALRETKLYPQRAAYIEEGDGAKLTAAQLRARRECALAITRAEITRNELPPQRRCNESLRVRRRRAARVGPLVSERAATKAVTCNCSSCSWRTGHTHLKGAWERVLFSAEIHAEHAILRAFADGSHFRYDFIRRASRAATIRVLQLAVEHVKRDFIPGARFERGDSILDALDARFDVIEATLDAIEPGTHFGRERIDLRIEAREADAHFGFDFGKARIRAFRHSVEQANHIPERVVVGHRFGRFDPPRPFPAENERE